MARKTRREGEEAAVDLTPMLDVVFIMLIFFIVTTSFVKEAGIDVLRPKATKAISKPSATIFIAIRPNGEIWMDKRAVDVERVGATVEKLLAESPTDTVIIQADKEAKHGVVVSVMDQIKLAGIDKISIAAENK
ncbi:biopolymer transporter ExbD [Rheinheimera soli]|jgi:biopolymer transport protein ExbD|uniref:Biopolymer transport protein ExbD n=1 Tax=Rheinheimera soli TaxID=443616 RepID=A0ABU1W1D5_9GAMM|nr:biopolymer transporter ExbD [Rheinheimera soli]MDR7121508.1 biopolymer transport protein ExbD [Rheinheimera soli]